MVEPNEPKSWPTKHMKLDQASLGEMLERAKGLGLVFTIPIDVGPDEPIGVEFVQTVADHLSSQGYYLQGSDGRTFDSSSYSPNAPHDSPLGFILPPAKPTTRVVLYKYDDRYIINNASFTYAKMAGMYTKGFPIAGDDVKAACVLLGECGHSVCARYHC